MIWKLRNQRSRSQRQTCSHWVHFVWFTVLFLNALPCSQAFAYEPPPADLDVLLRLLCQRGVANNERLKLGVTAWDQTSQAWIDSITKLAASRTPEVAKAVSSLKPATASLSEALAAEKQAEAERRNRKSNISKIDLVGTQIELMHGPDEFELDEMVRKRMITREQADERLKLRTQLKYDLMQKFGQDLYDNMVIDIQLEKKTIPARQRAEILRQAVVNDVLRSALQARSGAELNPPPLDLKFSVMSVAIDAFTANSAEKRGYVALRSNSATEFSQLTLLLEIQTTVGNRFEVIYLPSLPAYGNAHFDPITLAYDAIVGHPRVEDRTIVEVTGLRYSVWCKQFRATNVALKTVPAEELVNEVRLQTLRPGSIYVTRGGTDPNLTQFQFMEAKRAGRNTDEPHRRFIITFKSLKPVKQGYEVELDLTDHQPQDKKTTETQHYRGVFQLPPVKLSAPGGYVLSSAEAYRFGEVVPEEKETIVLKLTSGKQSMELHLANRPWDFERPEWVTRSGPAHPRTFVPDGVIPAADSPEGIARSLVQSAAVAKSNGKFDEALRTYQKLVAEYPGTGYEVIAKREIFNLDADKKSYAEGQKKLAEMRSAQEAFDKKRAEETKANEKVREDFLKKEAQIQSELDAANKLVNSGKYEAAIKAYQKFVTDHPEPGYVGQGLNFQFLTARKMSEAGHYADAQKVYERIIADYPDSPSASLSQGDLLRMAETKKKYPKGIGVSAPPPSLLDQTSRPLVPSLRGGPVTGSTSSGTKLTREQQLAQTRAQAEKDKVALNLVTQARQAITRKDYTLARGYLQQAINFSPDSGAGKQAKKLMEQLGKKK